MTTDPASVTRPHDRDRPPRRRSVHFVPGGNERFLARALASAADTLVFDLEDSVPPDHKDDARRAVAGWLGPGAIDAGSKELMVRINSIDTPWWREDVSAVAPLDPDSLMVPKVSNPAELDEIEDVLLEVRPEGPTSLFPVATETPAAVLAIDRIAGHGRVNGICWGAEDLSAALGSATARDRAGILRPVFRTVQSLCLIGAAAGGVTAVDAVWTDLGDLEGLRREAEESAAMGYVGKITIHPDQIDVVNAAYTPSPELIDESAELLSAFEESQRSGTGAFRFRGQMVDAPHLDRARRILALAGDDVEDLGSEEGS